MKKLFLLAIAGMFAFAACNNKTEEATENVDTTAQVEETVVQEQPATDSTATVDTTAAAAPATK
jgi:Na+-translocating ferredoxin:NAD+ oxidoreductase RnfC subunit